MPRRNRNAGRFPTGGNGDILKIAIGISYMQERQERSKRQSAHVTPGQRRPTSSAERKRQQAEKRAIRKPKATKKRHQGNGT